MKKSLLLGLGAVAMAFAAGAGVSHLGNGLQTERAIETKAGAIEAGDVVYLKTSTLYWEQDGAIFGIYSWGSGESTFTPMTACTDSYSTVYKATIPAGDLNLIFVRFAAETTIDNANGWNGRLNQSQDFALSGSTSNIWINSSWGKNDKAEGSDWGGNWSSATYSETTHSIVVFAGKTSGETYCYAWGSSGDFTSSYPGDPMVATTKAVIYEGSSLYRFSINCSTHMSDGSDVGLQMILSIGNDWDKTGNISSVNDGYYFSATGGKWETGYSSNENKGIDADIAWDLDADICNLSTTDADDLRSKMDGNKGYVTSATWDSYTWSQVYDFVDGQCTTPKKTAKVSVAFDGGKGVSLPIVVTLLTSVALVCTVGFVLVQKRKKD